MHLYASKNVLTSVKNLCKDQKQICRMNTSKHFHVFVEMSIKKERYRTGHCENVQTQNVLNEIRYPICIP